MHKTYECFVEAIKKREGSFWELNTSLNELNWMSESLSHLSVNNRLAFLGELLTKKGILTESSDADCVEYLMNLKDISIQPEKNKSYMISLLSLVDNQLLQMHPMFIGKVLDIIDDQYKIEMADGRVSMFPDKRISEKMATCTFFFAGQLSYDKFKTAIRLKFNTDLTEHHLRTCYS